MPMVESHVVYIHELYSKLSGKLKKASAHIVSIHIYHPHSHTHAKRCSVLIYLVAGVERARYWNMDKMASQTSKERKE